MKMKSVLMLSALGCAVVLSACKSESQDVPVPQDPVAENVTPTIKESYPDWQPTKEAPKGNAEYEAMFQNDGVTAPNAASTASEPVVVQQGTEVQAPTPVDESLKAQYPFLYAPAPAVVRLDINVDGSILVDGTGYPVEIIEKYLGKVVADNGMASVAIIRPASTATPMDKVNQALDLCRKAKIASVRFVNPGKDYGASKKATAAPAAQKTVKQAKVKYVVDSSVPATDYVIQNGDSLGKIALKFYKDVRHVHFILDANPKVKANPNKIRTGMKISVPAIKVQE